MVGFFCDTAKDDADGAGNQLKIRTPIDPEKNSIVPEGHSTELDGLSLASLEPFVDFEFIKDWMEEMQVPDNTECNKAELGCGLGENNCLTNANNTKISESLKTECLGMDGVEVEDKGGLVGTVTSNVPGESSLYDIVSTDLESAETKPNGDKGETLSVEKFEDASAVDVPVDSMSCSKLGSLSCSIAEGLEKVSLVGSKNDLVIDVADTKPMDTKVVCNIVESKLKSESESETESESENDTSSSSSSTSSSSSGSDDESNEMVSNEELSKAKKDGNDQKVDAEEGEIMDSDVEKMVSWTENGVDNDDVDDDDDDEEDDDGDDTATENLDDLELGDDVDDGENVLPKGPIRSKNELQDLPPVPPVTASLQPGHQILPVGVVSSVLGTQVVVEGSEKHNPISEGSILWITERRIPLGIIDEIFGPVKTPYYIVRYNSESEVPSDIQNGAMIGFVSEFAGHVLNDKNLYQKGYDASGENDEEVFEEAEFSDDEKEAEYRRMLKMSKRENNNESQGPSNKKKNRRNNRGRENTWTKNQQPSASQSPIRPTSQPNKMQQHLRSPSPGFSPGNQSQTGRPVFTSGPSSQSLGRNNQSSVTSMDPNFSGGPNTFTQMPHPGAVQFNRMPSQPQNMEMPSGFQPNGMPWMQQNYPPPMQMPPNGPFPWQQQQVPQFPLGAAATSQPQFDLSQLLAGFNGSPLGPMNFNMGGPNLPWSGMMGQNLSGQAPFMPGFQNPNVQLPVFQGFMPNGPQPGGVNSNTVPGTSFSGNTDASSQTHQGTSSGRGRGRKPFQHRGGRSGGRRGR